MMHQKIIHAPLLNPSRILDVGCGTGTVTCHLGREFPSAQVYGIDISPVRPSTLIPGNVSFIQGDLKRILKNQDTPLASDAFDYIFHRLLILGVTDWPEYVSDVTSRLRPGGWTEMQDYTVKMYRQGRECSQDWEWLRVLKDAASRKGIDLDCGTNIKEYMERAGLVDIAVREFALPFGTWAADAGRRPETRKIGAHMGRECGELYYQLVAKMLDGMGYEDDVLAELQNAARRDMSEEVGKEIRFYVTTGRKPETR